MAIAVPELTAAPAAVATPRSRFGLRGNLDIYLPVGFIAAMVLICYVGPHVLPIPDPNVGNAMNIMAKPFTRGALFGTDALGNDILSRVLSGGQISIAVGFGSQGFGFVVGSTVGMIAVLKGGIVESAIMRLMDVLIAFPSLVIAITIVAYLHASELHVIWAISYFTIPATARFARAQGLRIRELGYITSARLNGTKDWRILVRHLAPNIYPSLMTFFCLGTAYAIITEAGLSFLGLGVPAPAPSWGNMIAAGESNLAVDPYLVIIPGAFLFVTVMALNVLGDALRRRISSN